jgi:hypothetical protein
VNSSCFFGFACDQILLAEPVKLRCGERVTELLCIRFCVELHEGTDGMPVNSVHFFHHVSAW